MKLESNRKILACPPKCTARRRTAGMGTSSAVLTNAVRVCKIFVEDTSNIQRIL